ncbi:MAG TPA: sigma-70 factor domain-containing protein, partial [Micromonosporaceae bacterium]|nr:sigma-70 factor domain-containing protein [Micromonosporaceae bacterium]
MSAAERVPPPGVTTRRAAATATAGTPPRVVAGRVTPEVLDRPSGTGELAAEDIDGGEAASEDREGYVVSDRDDADQPAAQLGPGGATTDPVKDYLKQIGKVALLTAAQEVELAKRIEAGVFAGVKLGSGNKLAPTLRAELEVLVA